MTETKKCEHCEKDINLNIRICPFCGGEARDTSDLVLSPLCPRCNISLKVHTMDGEDDNLCPKCGGLWLDRETLYLYHYPRLSHFLPEIVGGQISTIMQDFIW